MFCDLRMGLKTFMAVYLSVIIAVSTFIVVAPRLQTQNEAAFTNHFSVVWMGFMPLNPSYPNQYPDYIICINNVLSDPLVMNIALQIKNQEDKGYYFKIGPYGSQPSGWSLPNVPLGFVDVDQTLTFAYQPTRTKPTSIADGVLTESINILVSAYFDSGLTNLYSEDNFTVTFKFIDRLSNVWSTVYYDNFDDGTSQGWSASSSSTSSDYYRSFPYSLKFSSYAQKSFSVAAGYSEAYLIFSLRGGFSNNFNVKFNGVTYFRPDVTPQNNVWYQFAIPVPIGQSTTIRLENLYSYSYLDEIYLIAK